ncbi:hypothetical protein [Cryptosporangium phraense]|uniref:hypothetical protein n=1 Tax=Cryptosporangium phraense TaxID=2593070 RepID=UPI0014790540|nr:hypothetical protein [Cryptosporangium phraense]
MAQQTEHEDVVVVGWLRGDDYEAALAYRRREDLPRPADQPKSSDEPTPERR